MGKRLTWGLQKDNQEICTNTSVGCSSRSSSHFYAGPVGGALGGRQLEFGWQARRDESGRVGTLQHAEQIKLGIVFAHATSG
jgi:hypothetical protein